MRRFLLQTGFSMVQGLIVSSMLAGSALVATRLIQDQKKLIKATETRDQIEQLHQLIYSTVQNREYCRMTLAMNSITTVAMDQTNTVTSIYSKTDTGTGYSAIFTVNDGLVYQPNKIYMNGNIRIQSMIFMTPKSSAPAGQNNLSYPSKIRVEYARLEGNDKNNDPTKKINIAYGGKRIVKEIPIIIQRTGSTIDSCYAVQLGDASNSVMTEGNNNLNQEFCSKLGTNGSLYIWDSDSNKCVLKNNICPDKFVFAGISSNGNAMCKPLTDYMGSMIDTSAVNCPAGSTVSLVTDGTGKVKIKCN